MTEHDRRDEVYEKVRQIARRVQERGGRALLVGGTVRDHLLGLETKDADVEIHGLSLDEVREILSAFGEVVEVGRAFGVFRVKGLDADFSLPRRDSKVGPGHRGFDVSVDPHLGIAEASRRRDLTINSMAMDPLTGEILDPHGGRRDLERGVLRATDPVHFVEDPLRGLRVAQFAARLEMEPDSDLVRLCGTLDLSELPGERQFEEFRKLLCRARRPSIGLEFLRRSELLFFFPELRALEGVPQDPIWHPEGDVWTHTCMVTDAAAACRDGGELDEALMFGALCHDFGKPSTTATGDDGRVRSHGHSQAGVPIAEAFLERLRAPRLLIDRVGALVAKHLVPAQIYEARAGLRAIRRLARRLAQASVPLELLVRVARADHLGRTTDDARAGRFPAGDYVLELAERAQVEQEAPKDVVLGRHLIARGLAPGPHFGAILARCRDIQDETGDDDPDRILDRALSELDSRDDG